MKQTLHLHCREFVSSETVFSSATNGGHKLIIPHHATQGFIALHLSGHSNFKVPSISHFSIIVTSVSSVKKLNGKASRWSFNRLCTEVISDVQEGRTQIIPDKINQNFEYSSEESFNFVCLLLDE